MEQDRNPVQKSVPIWKLYKGAKRNLLRQSVPDPLASCVVGKSGCQSYLALEFSIS